MDDSECLIEVNLQLGADAHVEILYTDLQNQREIVRLTAVQAWVIGDIIAQFDRRGIREFGQLLVEGAHEIGAEEEQ
ncbi:hypothetical protein [Nonomuraea wenchangensis]|uniref:hypothetical protein n=1 Tax=Nonomuraea wenchangensis TaxID=568860 RepID=UPI0033E348F5